MTENEKKDTKESKKEPETKEPDETTKATTEPTPEDVSALIEKTLAAEKEKGMKPEIKTALVILTLILLCIAYVYLMAFSDKQLIENIYLRTFIFTAVAGAVSALLGALILTYREKCAPIDLLISLFLIFTIPAIAFIFPLSKYHNQNQLQRDKKIAEILEITISEDGIEILLPSKHISDNSYLEKVFSIGWERKNYPWKTTADYCQKGKKIWYEAELPFQGIFQKGKEIVLYFDHAWYDYEITKEISFPDPNDPNSL